MNILEQIQKETEQDFKELWKAWEELKESLRKTNKIINKNKKE